ncbi:MAG: sulfurase [Rhodothermales bacterium]
MMLIPTLETLRYEGEPTVAALIEKPAPGVHVRVSRVDVLQGAGFAGDHARKSFWKGEDVPGRHVTAIAREVLDVLGTAWDVPGDNLVTSGVDLSRLKEGDRLRMGNVTLIRTAKPHRPCDLFARRTSEEARQAVLATGTRGALFEVESGGSLVTGQRVDVAPLITSP